MLRTIVCLVVINKNCRARDTDVENCIVCLVVINKNCRARDTDAVRIRQYSPEIESHVKMGLFRSRGAQTFQFRLTRRVKNN